MDDSQLLRYSRQIMLPQFGVEAQQCLLKSRVLLIGLGGLGSPVAMYLAAAGVGNLTLVDHDQVDLSNLQRQIIHNNARLGFDKVASAKETISSLNPDVVIHTINYKLDFDTLVAQCSLADLIVDATDNFAIRFAINRACVHSKKPLVSGAAIRMEGQVSVFNASQADSACYACLYHESSDVDETCSENGVLAPVVGIIGSIQATEAIKVLTQVGSPLTNRLLILDAETMQWRTLTLRKDPLCRVCGTGNVPE